MYLWHAWHIAAFHRAKKLPSLQALLKKKPKRITKEDHEELKRQHDVIVVEMGLKADEAAAERNARSRELRHG